MTQARPSHRGKYRGLDDRSRYYHLNKLFSVVAQSRDLRDGMICAGPGIYRIKPGLVLSWKAALADALPYLDDDEGRVRL